MHMFFYIHDVDPDACMMKKWKLYDTNLVFFHEPMYDTTACLTQPT